MNYLTYIGERQAVILDLIKNFISNFEPFVLFNTKTFVLTKMVQNQCMIYSIRPIKWNHWKQWVLIFHLPFTIYL